MSNLVDAIEEFKGTVGSSGQAASAIILELGGGDRYKNPSQQNFSEAKFQSSLSFIQEGMNDFFNKNQIKAPDLKKLDSGYEQMVFDCSNDYVLKISAGKPYKYGPRSEEIVQHPVHIGYSKELDASYEIVQKGQPSKTTFLQRTGLFMKALAHGNLVTDSSPENYMAFVDEKTGEKKLKVIDPGAITPLPLANFINNKTLCDNPIQRAINALKSTTHQFVDNIKGMFDKSPKIEPQVVVETPKIKDVLKK